MSTRNDTGTGYGPFSSSSDVTEWLNHIMYTQSINQAYFRAHALYNTVIEMW